MYNRLKPFINSTHAFNDLSISSSLIIGYPLQHIFWKLMSKPIKQFTFWAFFLSLQQQQKQFY